MYMVVYNYVYLKKQHMLALSSLMHLQYVIGSLGLRVLSYTLEFLQLAPCSSPIAQWVYQLPGKQEVVGSNHSVGVDFSFLSFLSFFLCCQLVHSVPFFHHTA